MLRIKKGFSEQLLQMALLLSLIDYDRLWPTFGIWPSAPPAEIEVGPLDQWGDDSYSNGFGPLTQIHPKSVDRYLDRQWLLNDLLSLGRYGDRYPSNIEAYLLNVDGDENGRDDQQQQDSGGQVVKTEPKENDNEDDDANRVFDTDIVEDVFMFAPEDVELVEALWKVDLDPGSSSATTDSRAPSPYNVTSVGSFLLPGDEPPSRNHTFSSAPGSSYPLWHIPPQNTNSSDLSPSSSSFPSQFERTSNSNGNSWEVGSLLVDLRTTTGESRSRRVSSDNDTETSDLDADESAEHKNDWLSNNNTSPSLTPEFRVKQSPFYEPSFEFDSAEFELFEDMMQCYSQPPPSSRHFQGRMGYTRTGNSGMDQRGWQDLATCSPMLAFPVEGQHHHHQSHYGQHPSSAISYPPGPGMYHHPHHHQHHHQHNNHNSNNNTGNVLLQNVSLCAPPLPPPPPATSIDMGHPTTSSSSSSLSHYHHHSSSIGVSTNCNLSSAVATSLHLPGSSSEQPAAFKTEPHQHEMMFPYQNHNNEMAPSSDGLLSSILNDDDLQLMDPSMGADGGMYPVRMMDTASSSVPCNNNSMNTATMVQNGNAGGGDSDSAVSSMGSERVPSLSSDTEWMETNSDSGHNDGYPSHSHQEYGKMRWLDNYLYSGSRGHSAAPQKKYQLYGRRLTDPVSGTLNATETTRPNHAGLVPDSLNLPYDMSVREGIPVPGSSQFNRHIAGCSRVMTPEHQVALNHTYALPAEGPRTPRNKLKSSSKRSEDEQLTRDEKRARNLNIPISVDDIINLPMDEFNERLSKYDLSESQLTLIRDIRRRGKNKVAAQNCRKRKLDQILSLADEVKQMKDRKFNLLQEREYLMTERMRVKTKYDLLYNHIFGSLRDPDGNPYSPYTHTLREQPDGSVSIVPRNNGTQTDRNPRSKQHKDK
ncbi:segmentation protein cap'n'collar-like isoform X2 [Melanaphis sacchari]|uniref:Segmentation protein cap'n'collar n=2 Tax=Melanaphis sacchari TaxID=742174 RepID=A0A2H8TT11_9HEMI|nr:segmentation protein cap'n'collar-like isoform X2 [Melanaphis sacchari]